MDEAAAKSAGMKEVAAAAGVSISTASNVLNRPEVVSLVTRARVETAMVDLHSSATRRRASCVRDAAASWAT
jgi:DNA-binding LacI/PurR family transcriptional regulator